MTKEQWHAEATRCYNSLTQREQRRWKNRQAFIQYAITSHYRGWAFLEVPLDVHKNRVARATEYLSDWKMPA